MQNQCQIHETCINYVHSDFSKSDYLQTASDNAHSSLYEDIYLVTP